MRAYVLLALLAAPALAHAQDGRVVLRAPRCDAPFAWESVTSLLALELSDDGVASTVESSERAGERDSTNDATNGATNDPMNDPSRVGTLGEGDTDDDARAGPRSTVPSSDRDPSARPTLASIQFVCGDPRAPHAVRVEIDDHVTRKRLTRDFDLSSLPERSRPRALALGAAELLRASWAELALPTVPTAEVPVPPDLRRAIRVVPRSALDAPRASQLAEPVGARVPSESPRSERAPIESHPRAHARAGAEVRAHASGNAALAGGFVHVDAALAPRVALRLGGVALHARATHPLGEVALLEVAGQVGVFVGARLGPLRLGIAPALELGWGRATGSTSRPDVDVDEGATWLASAKLELDAIVTLRERLELFCALVTTYPLRGLRARAAGVAFAGITGPSVGVAFGFGVPFGAT